MFRYVQNLLTPSECDAVLQNTSLLSEAIFRLHKHLPCVYNDRRYVGMVLAKDDHEGYHADSPSYDECGNSSFLSIHIYLTPSTEENSTRTLFLDVNDKNVNCHHGCGDAIVFDQRYLHCEEGDCPRVHLQAIYESVKLSDYSEDVSVAELDSLKHSQTRPAVTFGWRETPRLVDRKIERAMQPFYDRCTNCHGYTSIFETSCEHCGVTIVAVSRILNDRWKRGFQPT
jgi:hypothetical protein